MSSACTCHLNEWCFYCEMYIPLKIENTKLIKENDRYEKALELIEEEYKSGGANPTWMFRKAQEALKK